MICGAVEASCRCVLSPHGPEEPHACAAECGGKWRYDEHGRFVIVSLPIPTSVRGTP